MNLDKVKLQMIYGAVKFGNPNKMSWKAFYKAIQSLGPSVNGVRTEKEIKDKIKEIEGRYSHVLKGSMATVIENAPRALTQLSTTSLLSGLYFALGKERPKYEYELPKKRGRK
jgi:hypothetical protein